jgi:hypothetical protein
MMIAIEKEEGITTSRSAKEAQIAGRLSISNLEQ